MKLLVACLLFAFVAQTLAGVSSVSHKLGTVDNLGKVHDCIQCKGPEQRCQFAKASGAVCIGSNPPSYLSPNNADWQEYINKGEIILL